MFNSLSRLLAILAIAFPLTACVTDLPIQSEWTYSESRGRLPESVPTRPVVVPNPRSTSSVEGKAIGDENAYAMEIATLYANLHSAQQAIADFEYANEVETERRTDPVLNLLISNPSNETLIVYCVFLGFQDLGSNVLSPGDCRLQPEEPRKTIDWSIAGSVAQRESYIALASQLVLHAGDDEVIAIEVEDCPIPAHIRFLVSEADVDLINTASSEENGTKAWENRGQTIVVDGEQTPEYFLDQRTEGIGCDSSRSLANPQ